MEVKQIKKRRWLQFSIATMLILVTCLCGFMGGYRSGFNSGARAWKASQHYPMTYNVADLVAPSSLNADMDLVIATIVDAMPDEPEGSYEVRPFQPKLSLVISANGLVHERIKGTLAKLRAASPNVAREEEESREPAGSQWATQQRN